MCKGRRIPKYLHRFFLRACSLCTFHFNLIRYGFVWSRTSLMRPEIMEKVPSIGWGNAAKLACYCAKCHLVYQKASNANCTYLPSPITTHTRTPGTRFTDYAYYKRLHTVSSREVTLWFLLCTPLWAPRTTQNCQYPDSYSRRLSARQFADSDTWAISSNPYSCSRLIPTYRPINLCNTFRLFVVTERPSPTITTPLGPSRLIE